MSDTLLKIAGLTKAYPGVVANDDVGFDIRRGEIHALLGENGAGKSTLVKMIFGLVSPDRGSMTLDGRPFAPSKPSAARQAGVAMVFQHFSLFDALDVAENVALGMEHPPKRRDLAARIREVSELYGLPLDPTRVVGTLSAGERQRVEITRCLLQDPRLLIMDEPTSVLTPQEVGILFGRCATEIRGHGDPLHLPQAGGDPHALRPCHDPAAGPEGGHLHTVGDDRARTGGNDGRRQLRRASGQGTRPGKDAAGAARSVDAGAGRLRHAPARSDSCRSPRARCWASAASPGTGRTSCFLQRFPASGPARRGRFS